MMVVRLRRGVAPVLIALAFAVLGYTVVGGALVGVANSEAPPAVGAVALLGAAMWPVAALFARIALTTPCLRLEPSGLAIEDAGILSRPAVIPRGHVVAVYVRRPEEIEPWLVPRRLRPARRFPERGFDPPFVGFGSVLSTRMERAHRAQ